MVPLDDPVVRITIATVSCHSPLGYAVASLVMLLCFRLRFPFEIPKVVYRHMRVLGEEIVDDTMSEECLKGRVGGPAPESRPPSTKASHPPPNSALSA